MPKLTKFDKGLLIVTSAAVLTLTGSFTIATTAALADEASQAAHDFGMSLQSPDAQMTHMIMESFAREKIDPSQLIPVTIPTDEAYDKLELGTDKPLVKAFMAPNTKNQISIGVECVPKPADELGIFETSGALKCVKSYGQTITFSIPSKVKAPAHG